MLDNVVVLDLETSGPNPFVHDVLSVAFVPLVEGKSSLSIFIRVEDIQWTEFSKQIFSDFSDEWELKAVDALEACATIENYLRENFDRKPVTVLGHNIGFDVAFLRKLAFLGGRSELKWLSHRAIDTHTLLYMLSLKKKIPAAALTSSGAFEFFDIHLSKGNRHTALGDAIATRSLFLKLLEQYEIE